MTGWRRGLGRRFAALTALLALVAVAPVLGRFHWAADLCSHLVPHTLGAAMAAVAVLSACRWRRWAVLALVVAVVQAVRMAPYHAPATAVGPGSVRGQEAAIRLVQWNVNSANERSADVVRWLLEHGGALDVVALLEITPASRRALEDLAPAFPHALVVPRSDNFGIAVFSRLPGTRLSQRQLDSTGLPSIVMEAGGAGSGSPLRIIVTHPGPPLGEALWEARNHQLDRLAAVVWESASPTILVGDLNVTRWSTWFTRLARDADLRDAQRGRGYAATWAPTALPIWLGLPIDHTLVTRDIEVLARTHGPRLGSDHRAVVTEFKIRRPKPDSPRNPGRVATTGPTPDDSASPAAARR